MSHLLRVGCFGLILFVLGTWDTAELSAQKKKEPANKSEIASAADYKAIQYKKEMTGTVVGMSGTTLMFRVDFPHYEPNPKYKDPAATGKNPAVKNPKGNPQANQQMQLMKTYADLMRQQQIAATAKNPQERQRALQKAQQDMIRFQQQNAQFMAQMQKSAVPANGKDGKPNNNANAPFIVVTTSKNFELELDEKVGLRKLYLAFEYDDIGNIKKYNEKEIAELRGTDKSKPGYTAKMDEVAPGAEVKLTLIPVKPAKKEDKKNEEEDIGNAPRPTISHILLTKEGASGGLEAGAPPKKKAKK